MSLNKRNINKFSYDIDNYMKRIDILLGKNKQTNNSNVQHSDEFIGYHCSGNSSITTNVNYSSSNNVGYSSMNVTFTSLLG
jgi:hypothetical protein